MRRASGLLAVAAGLFLAATATAHSQEPPPEPESTEQDEAVWTLVQAGTLIAEPGIAEPGSPVLRNQTIIIKDGRIEQIVAGFAVDQKLMPNATIIDLSDSFVLPGLIDAHVHLMSGNDDGDGDAFAVATVVRNARMAADAGVTTVRDMGSSGLALQAYRAGWQDRTFTGPRVVLSGPPINAGVEDGDCFDASSCKKAVRSRFAQGADWIKLYATCSGFEPCGKGSAPGLFTPDELQAVFAVAATRSIPVAAHAHSVGGINDALRAGARSIEHGSNLDEVSIKLFLENKAYLVPTLSVLNFLEEQREGASEEMLPIFDGALAQHPKGVAAALRAGVMIGAGSDAPLTGFGDFHQELAWLVKIGMTPMQALRAATVVNAQMLNLEGEIGVIAVGRSADIIAVSADPALDIAAMASVDFVMIKGEVVKSPAPSGSHPAER